MKRYVVLFGWFLGACTSNTTKAKTDESKELKEVRVIDSTSPFGGCYKAVLQKDTSDLVLQHKKDATTVSGDLSIKNFSKDSSKGTINGIIEGDLIVAWYDFFSEGKHSVRQVVFKLQGDQLLKGYGNLVNKGKSDTLMFENIGTLKYLTEMPFIKKECK
jgi:hypothetical protein